MGSRRAGKPHRPAYASPPVAARRSHVLTAWLAPSFVVTSGVLLLLFLSDVRFGEGFFAIRYSPVAGWRLQRAIPVLLLAALACGAVWALSQRDRAHAIAGRVMLALALLGSGLWAWCGPPEPMNQQAFNMTSFSTDGAFVVEAKEVESIRAYLRDFARATLPKTPHEMGGTRVLSNPPLTTALAYAVYRAGWNPPESPGWLERMLIEEREVNPRDASTLANGLRFSVVLTAIWVLSGWAAWALGRLFLSPSGAAVFALLVTLNPCTLHFSPGKDPAQLLTINVMLWAWFAGWQRRSMSLAAVGGAVLTIGATGGLIHIWVALVAFAATLWQARVDASVRTTLLNAVGAAVGGAVVCTAAYATIGWNIPHALWTVSRRWSELQSTFQLSRPVWYAIGLPMFLLFLTPAFWAFLGLSLRRRRLRFGTRLAICTAGVMLLIYGPLGMTYELPRLWVAFLPTLALGLMIDRPLFRARGTAPRAGRALVVLVAVHLGFTTLHWTLFDARESEYRLNSERFYG